MTYDITISGASDDLIEIEGGAPGCDEYPAEDGSFLVVGPDDRKTRVRVSYQPNGTWAVAVAPVGEDVPMHKVRVTARRYTAVAEINDVRMVVPLDVANGVEPSDDQIYNGHGMEGGIAYTTAERNEPA